MICGVQGDFTRSLVNDPPKHIWTRELKVSEGRSRTHVFRSRRMFALTTRYLVCRRVKHFHIVQAWCPYLHRYRYRCCVVDMHPIPVLVSALFRFTSMLSSF